MPDLVRAETTIHYQVRGSGHPLLLIAPGGMRSQVRWWSEQPGRPGQRPGWIDPLSELSDDFRVIGMDQRNAGGSTAPIASDDGWGTYVNDQLALLDHLGVKRFHVMGGCIGCSYALGLCEAAPERVVAAVLQNPIGLSEDNRPAFGRMFDEWEQSLRPAHPELDDEVAASFRKRMFGGEFVFSVSCGFVAGCPTPLLVLAGNDDFHPRPVAEQIASLAPSARLVLEWSGDEHRDATRNLVRDFLLSHS